MSDQWHNGPNGPGRCGADPNNPNGRGCRFGGGQHFATQEEAYNAYEQTMKSEHGATATITADGATDAEILQAIENDPNYTTMSSEDIRRELWEASGVKAYMTLHNGHKIPLENPSLSLNGTWREITPDEADAISEDSAFHDEIVADIAEKYDTLDYIDDNLLEAWKYDLPSLEKEVHGTRPDYKELEEISEKHLKEDLVEMTEDHDIYIDNEGEATIFQGSGGFDEESEWQDEANYQALSNAFDAAGIKYSASDGAIKVNMKDLSNSQGGEIGELLETIREDVVLDAGLYYDIEASHRGE